MASSLRARLAALTLATAATLTPVVGGTAGQPATAAPATHQVVTWGASADRVPSPAGLTDQTVRNLVHTSIGGTGVRISLSNAFGDRPVTFDSVYVGLQEAGADLVAGSNRELTFGGDPTVTVGPGAEVLSDPLAWELPADTTIAVSAHVVGASGAITGHNLAMQTSYVSGPGDAAADESGAAFGTAVQSWYWVETVVVDAPQATKTVAFLGDSITDGHSSTPGANRRWPDVLADRLAATRQPATTA